MKTDELLQGLPRSSRRFPNAVVWLDASGRIRVEVGTVGALVLTEESPGLFRASIDDDY